MSTGGTFQLLANTGEQDKFLLATEVLNKRLNQIEIDRCRNPNIKNKMPTLVEIERTHIIYVNAHFKPFVSIAYEYNKIGVQEGDVRFGNEITFSIPQFGDFFHDMVLNIKLTGLGAGVTSSQARYCDFLGHRLLKRTIFEVNGNILDEYSSNVYNFHYNFRVPDQKKRSYKENVGQEIPYPAYLSQNPGVDNYREVKYIVDGPQTLKTSHVSSRGYDLEMFIPLLFWFNLDPRLSIPSVSIPYGQRFIKILLAELNEICQGFPTTDFAEPQFEVVELYINNIFVNPEIHNIFIKRIGFSLIRLHKEEVKPINNPTASLKLDQLKFPIETLYCGVLPNINVGSMDDWNSYHLVNNVNIPYPIAFPNPGIPPPNYILGFSQATYKQQIPVLDFISVESIGIELWRPTPEKFFNTYVPYNYGGFNICSPEDKGMYMIPFNLYPGTYQPSGYISLSKTREFYVNYQSSIISSIFTANFYFIAIAINFLIIAEGTAILRYNT